MSYHVSTAWAVVIAVLALWELVWKGFALWRSSQRKQLNWFLAILLINSAGIIPIVYLLNYGSSKRSES